MLPPWQILIKEPLVSGVVIEGIVEKEKSEKFEKYENSIKRRKSKNFPPITSKFGDYFDC